MASEMLTTSPPGLLLRRGFAGAPIEDAYRRLRSTIAARLSSAHAALLAEPRSVAGGIEWHAAVGGPSVRLTQADVARRAAVMQRLGSMTADLRKLADRIAPESASAQQLARLLREIAHVPSPQQVWLVADQPVIVGWAHEAAAFEAAASGKILATLDGGSAVRGLSAAATAEAASGRATAAARSTGGDARWLGGILLPLALLGILAWMLLRPPAWLPGGASGRDDLTALQHQLDQLATIDPAACHVAVRQ